MLPEPNETYQMLSFLLSGEGENAVICPLLWRQSSGMPQTIQQLKVELNVTSPWIFVGIISHPL